MMALWTWAKWTVQSWLLPRDPLLDLDHPGDDDQFHLWNINVQCSRCLDWLDEDDDMKLIDGEWTCGMCRKGREDG